MGRLQKKERVRIFNAILIPVLFVLALWVIFFLERGNDWELFRFGIYPGEWSGMVGILTGPLVHGDIYHLINNSTPLLVLGWSLFYFYKRIAFQVFIFIYLISGLLVWLSARPSFHIGASSVIYGLFTFLFFSGVLRKHPRLISISLLVVFLYGSMLWGILPIRTDISWEGHLWGAITGVALAFHFRKEGPQRPKYQWEIEEEEEKERSSRPVDHHHHPANVRHYGHGHPHPPFKGKSNNRKVVYHYKKKNKGEGDE